MYVRTRRTCATQLDFLNLNEYWAKTLRTFFSALLCYCVYLDLYAKYSTVSIILFLPKVQKDYTLKWTILTYLANLGLYKGVVQDIPYLTI